jgi:hypothetical protein
MDLEELRERRRKLFQPTRFPKGLLMAPVLLVGVVAIGYFMLRGPGGTFAPPVFLFPTPPPVNDGTVRLIPPEVTTRSAMPDDAPEANVVADIVITETAVLLGGKQIVALENGALAPKDLTEEGIILPLFGRLRTLGVPPTPVPTPWRIAAHISADRGTQYKVLKAVGDTAQKAGFKDMGFETLSPPEEAK